MSDRWHYELTPLGWCVFRHVEPQMWFFPDQYGRCPSLCSDDFSVSVKLDRYEPTVRGVCAIVVCRTKTRRFGGGKSHTREVLAYALAEALNAWEASSLVNKTRPPEAGSSPEAFRIGVMPVELLGSRQARTGDVGETRASVLASPHSHVGAIL